MKRYIFLSGSIVKQVIVGDLSPNQLATFVEDYRRLFGIDSAVIVEDDRSVWMNGTYDSTSGEFSPPPSSEPEPVIVDGTSEVIVEETTNAAAPNE